jgi:hypothetical protein
VGLVRIVSAFRAATVTVVAWLLVEMVPAPVAQLWMLTVAIMPWSSWSRMWQW